MLCSYDLSLAAMSEVREGGPNTWLASNSLALDLGKTDNHDARFDRFSGTRDTSQTRPLVWGDILDFVVILIEVAQQFQFCTALCEHLILEHAGQHSIHHQSTPDVNCFRKIIERIKQSYF